VQFKENKMNIDYTASLIYVVSATALLGSPGPAIACLLAVGRAEAVSVGVKYLTGMLIGLASAAAICAFGAFSLMEASPLVFRGMSICAAMYLVYLAYKIATSPVGSLKGDKNIPSSFFAGMFVGLSNPKAYVAFISLFASHALISNAVFSDNLLKWLLTVLVMITVDTAWLFIGVSLKKINFNVAMERAMNVVLGALVLITTIFAFL
jgi:threonine/homoserine/homoserine lactone efflux protein